ncbi:MAG TPA: class I SAM-dependent methyltransferase [Blastocatellia bacterium]|nr:class I SAM-dependent methyltransferase [Blastocatellia bacterium]
MLKPIDEPLIRALRLDAPCRIADLGCGGGGTTLETLRQAPAGSIVHGFDISPALIESARARVRSDEHAIAFALADVATAPTPEEPYHRLISRFGIMFYDDPPNAFANLARWLAPDGRFAFAVWGRPAENPWITSIREAAAGIIDLPPLDPEAPGPFRYAEAGKLRILLERAGLDHLEVCDWRGTLLIGGGLPAAEAAQFSLASSSIGELIAEAGAETLDHVRRSLTALFSRHQQDGMVRMDACVQIVTGACKGPRPPAPPR